MKRIICSYTFEFGTSGKRRCGYLDNAIRKGNVFNRCATITAIPKDFYIAFQLNANYGFAYFKLINCYAFIVAKTKNNALFAGFRELVRCGDWNPSSPIKHFRYIADFIKYLGSRGGAAHVVCYGDVLHIFAFHERAVRRVDYFSLFKSDIRIEVAHAIRSLVYRQDAWDRHRLPHGIGFSLEFS